MAHRFQKFAETQYSIAFPAFVVFYQNLLIWQNLLKFSVPTKPGEYLHMKYPAIQNFINGSFQPSSSDRKIEVISPVDGTLLSTVPMSTSLDLKAAVKAAKAAFPGWSKTPIKERVQVFFRYKILLEAHMDELAALCTEENGKTISESVAEIEKCIELTEFATSLPQLVTGEILEVSKGVECRTDQVPLGVVASIVPFNFPAMVPNWTIPNAIALGNCMILKPSEKVPLSAISIAQLLKEAGLPDGVFNIVNGEVVMVAVGEVDAIIEKICEEARKIIPGENLGAVINRESKERIERYITEAEQLGARVLVDGRNAKVPGREKGTYVGPTVIDWVKPEMAVAREEIFGPVISIMRTNTVDEALAIENANPYGNAASVFTQNGGAARYIMERASAGMVGVNVGVPVPREPFSFGGWNESKFGVGDITGKSSIAFWTKLRKSTTKWNPEAGVNWMS
jgi:acyl-CoA reductase-like NAD-dependent aldehyde dehydrogenase